MDEIKAEEEKRKHTMKAKIHSKKRTKTLTKSRKKHKVHKTSKNELKSGKNLKIKHNIETNIETPVLGSETQDGIIIPDSCFLIFFVKIQLLRKIRVPILKKSHQQKT